MYVADEGNEPALRQALRDAGVDVERAMASTALVLAGKSETHLKHGAFDPEKMLAFWKEAAGAASRDEFSSLYAAGETDWTASAPGPGRWMEYESRLTSAAVEHSYAILCQYQRRRFPPQVIHGVIRTHPTLIWRGSVCSNPYHVPPRQFLDGDGAEREWDVDRLLDNVREREHELRRSEGLLRKVGEELKEANARNAEILESITDAFTAFDRDWRFVYVNERAVQLLGKPREQLIGQVAWEVFPEGVGMEHYDKFQHAMAARVPLVCEGFSPSANKWYANHIYPTKEGLAFYWSDITDLKQAQEELRRSSAHLAEGQHISHTGSWAWNVSTGELYWSVEHFRICGVDAETFTLTVQAAQQLIHPEDRAAANQNFYAATRAGRDFEWQGRMLHPDGTVRHVQSAGHPIYGASGELVEYVGTIIDITERMRGEQALQKAQSELARANRIMTMGELAASIAHEVNQPLAAVAANASACMRWLAGQPPNIAETEAGLRRIGRDANRASEVIDRIRALLARRDSRKAQVHVDEVIREVVELVQAEARAREVTIMLSIGHLPPLLADRVQLQQIMLNLVMNAIEALDGISEGRRVIQVIAEHEPAGEVHVAVRDSGAGVDPQHRERIFDAFYTTKRDGIGMGLAISRSIVEAHGGRLWASSNEHHGATFHFTLPG